MKPFAIASLAAATLMLLGCKENPVTAQPLNIISGHIQLAATPDRPAVGYFTIQGGPRDVELVAVTADLAQRVEMHETIKNDQGLTEMKTIERVAVPARTKVQFQQGGKHLMIWNINGAAVRAGKLPMAFVFTNNNNERILFDLPIKQPVGGTAEHGKDHGTMDHGAMDHGAKGEGTEKAAPNAAKK